ncbi:MAG: AAA family ATPase [Pseudomonadota bacterium]
MTTSFSLDQATAWDNLITFIHSDSHEYALSGPAGTGKTFLISRLAAHLAEMGYRLHLTATTNKAARVASRMADQEPKTIHSLLGLQPVEDVDQGRQVLQRKREPAVASGSLVIVDEASMVQRELLKEIRSAALDANAKVLFVGDAYQLPPVFEQHAPVFSMIAQQSHLTTVHRQALENPLLATATAIRQVLDGAPFPHLQDAVSSVGGMTLHNREEWGSLALSTFASDEYAADPDHCRMLGWTNAFVREANRRIRRHVLGSVADSLPFIPGERMINNNAIGDEHDLILSTDEPVQILTTQRSEVAGVPGWQLKVRSENSGEVDVFCAENWQQTSALLSTVARPARALQDECNRLKKVGLHVPSDLDSRRRAAWRLFFDTKRQFADLRPPFASTVHKSQGSTFQHVFIHLSDIGRNTHWQEVVRLLYVALTRPAQHAFMMGNLPAWLTMIHQREAA